MKRVILTLFLIVFLTSFISAEIICGTNLIEKTIEEGQDPGSSDIFLCNNTGTESVTVSKSGNFFSVSETTPFVIGPGNVKGSLSVEFNQVGAGNYEGLIYFSDGSSPINIYLQVEEGADPTGCYLNPTLVTYTQTVQQGTEFELPKVTFNPKNCEGEFSITPDTAYISGGVSTSEGQKPVYIKSSSSTEIILGVNTKGLSSAPYTSKLTLSAFDQTFSDISTINIIVIGGTNPDTDFDVTKIPTCSLTNNILNTNSTYSMVCTNIIPGVSIHPIINSNYIMGLGPGSDMTSTNFVWEFQPKKLGNTNITAEFRYLDMPVGNVFSQEVKIQSSGSVAPGTSLKLVFTPGLDKAIPGEDVIIQLVDNKSNSLVEDPELYVDAVKLYSLNTSEKSFPFKFELGKEYEIRGKSSGYNDLVETVNITSQKIEITFSPSKEFYNVNEVINISTNVENTTLLLDNTIITSPYALSLSGTFLIEAKKEGYLDGKLNITVKSIVSYTTLNIEVADWKKGKNILMYLTENTSWSVEYEEPYKIDGETHYKEPIKIAFGETQEVEFSFEEYGRYTLKEDGSIIISKIIEKKGIWNWIKNYWYWFIVGLIVLIGIYLIFFKGKGEEEGGGFYGPPQTSEG